MTTCSVTRRAGALGNCLDLHLRYRYCLRLPRGWGHVAAGLPRPSRSPSWSEGTPSPEPRVADAVRQPSARVCTCPAIAFRRVPGRTWESRMAEALERFPGRKRSQVRFPLTSSAGEGRVRRNSPFGEMPLEGLPCLRHVGVQAHAPLSLVCGRPSGRPQS